ncbi:hypothetical protein TVAG_093300 [Trichomonas vaginalis G3]|uniref:Uncharacterized protein n=1 Tax=Trichomonas vaginalis (strain ATCC PRA-98 / G3) TaxID=412133 RepID=A2DBF3_TRIV3|nr:hypothetical protein TVAGG3_0382760 [Trichomonas vaginalis G3]EAY22156.1 hypothetical protein TVAG_093300 [Trichomonas vaginalis G3]KAI5533396.1 hypothetical protein TVAGG3_0382760 [Trichomonas vaginalis G3]|eukprot:XP_001583142.1 hypothetical protein [Trichomonas vaginalis G3]
MNENKENTNDIKDNITNSSNDNSTQQGDSNDKQLNQENSENENQNEDEEEVYSPFLNYRDSYEPAAERPLRYGENIESVKPYKPRSELDNNNPDLFQPGDIIRVPYLPFEEDPENPNILIHHTLRDEFLSYLALDQHVPLNSILERSKIVNMDANLTNIIVYIEKIPKPIYSRKYQLFAISIICRSEFECLDDPVIAVIDGLEVCFNKKSQHLESNIYTLCNNFDELQEKISKYQAKEFFIIDDADKNISSFLSSQNIEFYDISEVKQEIYEKGQLFMGIFNYGIGLAETDADFYIRDDQFAQRLKFVYLSVVSLWNLLTDEYKSMMIDEYANYVKKGASLDQIKDYFKRLVKMAAVINGKTVYEYIIHVITQAPRLFNERLIRNLNDDWKNLRSFYKSKVEGIRIRYKRTQYEAASNNLQMNAKTVIQHSDKIHDELASTKSGKYAANQIDFAMDIDMTQLLEEMKLTLKKNVTGTQ